MINILLIFIIILLIFLLMYSNEKLELQTEKKELKQQCIRQLIKCKKHGYDRFEGNEYPADNKS